MINAMEIDIQSLLPQQPPFVIVDKMLYCNNNSIATSLTVVEDSIFVENNELTEAGVMENIAQTCAARIGYNTLENNRSDKIKIGFIGSIKNLVIEEFPKVGDELITTVNVVNEVFNITLVNAKIEVKDKLFASCEMKISLSDIDSHSV